MRSIFDKHYTEPSIFNPENLLREGRRQKRLPDCNVPEVCILDPDGDIVRYLEKNNLAELNQCWACYHSNLYTFKSNGLALGIIGCAVGSSYAVLVAEQLFVSGCQLLISVTSAGIINPIDGSDFIIITESLRDEGTSFHYLPDDEKSEIDSTLLNQLSPILSNPSLFVSKGKSWTTDAPYRETQSSIDHAKSLGITAVEMEAAALYAYAKAKNKSVVCFAHLTNTMAQQHGDFEKGEENGSISALRLIEETVNYLYSNKSLTLTI
jgi:uridine phosphorylase